MAARGGVCMQWCNTLTDYGVSQRRLSDRGGVGGGWEAERRQMESVKL